MGWWSQTTGFVPRSSEWELRQARRLRRVLLALDGSGSVGRGLALVQRLAQGLSVDVTLLRAVERPGEAAAALSALEVECGRLPEGSLAVRPRVVVGPPSGSIVCAAEALDAQLVVMATRSRPASARLLTGSVAHEVLRLARAPVLLVGPRAHTSSGRGPLRRVLLPVDQAHDVFPDAERVAPRDGEPLLLHVRRRGATDADVSRTLDAAAERLAAPWQARRRRLVAEGSPAAAILSAVESERVDLVALTTRPRGHLEELWEGSVTEAVVRASPTPVLVRRGPARPRPAW